jgi:hypothetical protein
MSYEWVVVRGTAALPSTAEFAVDQSQRGFVPSTDIAAIPEGPARSSAAEKFIQ